MNLRSILFFALFLFLSLTSATAESESLLMLRITPQVVDQEHQIAWEQPLAQTTRPGTPVVVNINAQGLDIRVTVTTFIRGEDFLLVVQGEVKQLREATTRRSTSLQSLLVPPGETIVFFPLGRETTGSEPQMVVLIRVEYQDE